MKRLLTFIFVVAFLSFTISVIAQIIERPRPPEWKNLVYGGRFMDRFLPMPTIGPLTRDTWGADNVLPRDIKNGIESKKYSLWGGNKVLGDDGKYHMLVCGWPESSPRGHAAWPNSLVFHAISDNLYGPFVITDTLGKGHNPEVFRLTDKRYVLYIIGGCYIADNINGPWKYGKLEYINRDRRLIEGNSNFTFARREDGSYLMICRGGGQWFSQTGFTPYGQVTGTRLDTSKKIIPLRAYPAIQGNFEDPVVWRDNVQYNLIVNDWLGRIAFYERSKDGVNWKVESGEAYLPGVSVHEDGTVEAWWKYERLKVFQDKYGRAIQGNFAVIDVEKNLDKGNDIHSSKNISIPITAGRLLTILDKKPITASTKTIKVKISAEPGFNPQNEIDIKSLQFGEPEAVNYGKGGKVLKTQNSGADLIITFDAAGSIYPADEFAAKMLGKTSSGKLLFGYARLPGINFIEPILSPLLPVITPGNNGFSLKIEVQNFGQVASKIAKLKVVCIKDNKDVDVAAGTIPALNPFEKTTVELSCGNLFEKGVEYIFKVTVNPDDIRPVILHGKITPVHCQNESINLAGEWQFKTDSADKGISEHWYSATLPETVILPGSMSTNGKGDDVTLYTKWTGYVWDNAWFKDSAYAKYRQPGNIKVSFWLQPLKHYVGVAWYQKKLTIPATWKEKNIELFLERCHWETTLWVDTMKVSIQNALGTPHVYSLGRYLSPGGHTLTIRIDNRIKAINVGDAAHSVTDNTQTNWNGIIGKLTLIAYPSVFADDIQLYPDIDKKLVVAKIYLKNSSGKQVKAVIKLSATSKNKLAEKLSPISKEVEMKGDSAFVEIAYPMGANPLFWDEFHPNLYSLNVKINSGTETVEKDITFGMRKFATRGTQFTINGRLTFLRGTLECCIFPKTGYPSMDTAAWMHIFKVCRSYGLNHMRFHSWCPPEAAFIAADHSGFYLYVECGAWTSVGNGEPIDTFLYAESRRIATTYGNHPSFCMMSYGNEPEGKKMEKYLNDFVTYWKNKDPRRLYTSASGWPMVPANCFYINFEAHIQSWDAGTNSIINAQPPKSNYNWGGIIAQYKIPYVSHEIGQWCVYPDFKEIPKYDGVVRAKNFEIFKETLENNGMGNLADSFLLASGKLQALCYKADIEAALRTPGFGGFQLLDLHDFPGQGTALVGVVNAFWEDKGYITGSEYSRFCNSTVPLALLPKHIYNNNEELVAPVQVAHFGEAPLNDITPVWSISEPSGKILFKGQLAKTNIAIGNGIALGEIKQSLASVVKPSNLVLSVKVGEYQNNWEIFVYPATLPAADEGILVTQKLDANAIQTLKNGGKVLLTIKKGTLKPESGDAIKIGFSSIFWNTSWTKGQAPHTLGILCNPTHPAFNEFPTEYYSNWQWWDAMAHSNAIVISGLSSDLKPIVRVIDDWFTNRPLALIFEAKVGNGKIMVSGIDLITDSKNRPEARQLLYSLEKYMGSKEFQPSSTVDVEKIKGLFNNE